MQIQSPTVTQFKGYDARKIKALCIGTTRGGVAHELCTIGKKVGFDVFVPVYPTLINVEQCVRSVDLGHKLWLQDLVIPTPKNTVIPIFSAELLATQISKMFDRVETRRFSKLPPGGNMFFVKNNEREDLLIGADNGNLIAKNDDLKSLLGVENVDIVPQMDFHIDMFLRPLENKNTLLTDDEMMVQLLIKGLSCINKALAKPDNDKQNLKKVYNNLAQKLREFRQEIDKNSYAKFAITEKYLKKQGYNPIRVPGRIYSIDSQGSMRCTTNFMNAVVTKNDNGELVYITNKSYFDEDCGITPEIKKQIGFSLEDEFKKSILAYVKPENVYFVEGEGHYLENLLECSFGGLHCITTEII